MRDRMDGEGTREWRVRTRKELRIPAWKQRLEATGSRWRHDLGGRCCRLRLKRASGRDGPAEKTRSEYSQ